jgi:hypothetical protein
MSELSIVPARAVGDRRLTHADFRVLSAIGTHTGRNGEGAWASGKTTAAEATVTRSQFFVSAKKLLELGYVHRKSRHGRTSMYAIELDPRGIAARYRNWRPVRKCGTGEPVPRNRTGRVPVHGTQTVPSGQFNDGERPLAPSRAASRAVGNKPDAWIPPEDELAASRAIEKGSTTATAKRLLESGVRLSRIQATA